jgi:hypothetical protein
VSTDGKLALWETSKLPTGPECRNAVAEHPARQVTFGVQTLVCYLDRDGEPGYISATAVGSRSTVVDTAHLR